MSRVLWMPIAVSLISCWGCAEDIAIDSPRSSKTTTEQPAAENPDTPAASPAAPVQNPAAVPATTENQASPSTPENAPILAPPTNTPPATAPPAVTPPPDPDYLKKAEAGVGKKGRGYGGGILTEPIHVKFLVEQRIIFEIQVPKAMQLYKALNNRAPRSHDEFMKVIIKENQISLPPLPPGDRYVYVPESEELMVELSKDYMPVTGAAGDTNQNRQPKK